MTILIDADGCPVDSKTTLNEHESKTWHLTET